MKSRWLLAVILLVSISIVRAEMVLDGPFFNAYNMGDRLNLAVTITHANNLNGFLKATLQCSDASLEYYLVPLELTGGVAKKIQIGELPIQPWVLGSCNVVVELLNGARQSIEKIQSNKLEISDKLRLESKLNKLNLLPGESIVVSGTVRNIRGEKIRDGDVKLYLDGEFFTKVKEGEFGYEFKLGNDYKAGSHSLLLEVSDLRGNKAVSNFSFNVQAVAKKLEARLNALTFKPGDLVVIEALLYDQAGEKINGDASIKLYNNDDKLVVQKTINTGESVEYTLPEYSKPGEWKLELSAGNLKTESSLDVEIVEKLDFVIDDQKVVVTNIGNVVYTKPIELLLSDMTITKKTSLKPGETVIIDLGKEDIPSGQYNLEVRGGDTGESFDGVEVEHAGRSIGEELAMLPGTGQTVLGSADDPIVNPYYAGAAGLAATTLSYLGYRQWRRKSRMSEKIKTMQIREAEKMAKEIRTKKEKQPFKYASEQDKHKELMEYRDRILAGIDKEKKDKELSLKKAAVNQQAYSFSNLKTPGNDEKLGLAGEDSRGEIRFDKDKDKEFGFSSQAKDAEEEDFSLKEKKKDKEEEGYFNFFGD